MNFLKFSRALLDARSARALARLGFSTSLEARVLALFALLGVISYFAMPLAVDPAVHMTGIHQAKLRGDELTRAWTFRGPIYNAYLSLLYDLATMRADFFDPVRFDRAVKELHFLAILGSAVTWGVGLARGLLLPRSASVLLGIIALMAMTVGPETRALHAEDVATVVVFACVGLAASGKWGAVATAGLLASALPLIKGSTAVLCLPAALAVLLPGARSWWNVTAWALAFLIGATIQFKFFWLDHPVAVSDLLEAGAYQGVSDLTFAKAWADFRYWFALYFENMPLLGSATFLLPWLLARLVAHKHWMQLILVVSAWVTAIFVTVLQDHYFTYHLGLATLAFALTIGSFLCSNWSRLGRRQAVLFTLFGVVATLGVFTELDHPHLQTRPAMAAALVFALAWASLSALKSVWLAASPKSSLLHPGPAALVVVAFATLVPWLGDEFARSTKPDKRAHELERQHFRMDVLEEDYELAGEEVLFLTYGETVRFSRAKSACRHFFPVPVQRFDIDRAEQFEEQEGFQENRDCIMGYRGKYILLDKSWMYRSGMAREIHEHLKKSYGIREHLLDTPGARDVVLLARKR